MERPTFSVDTSAPSDSSSSNSSDTAFDPEKTAQRLLLSKFHSRGSPSRVYSFGPDTAGCGTFGVVQVVTEKKTGRQFACKIVRCQDDCKGSYYDNCDATGNDNPPRRDDRRSHREAKMSSKTSRPAFENQPAAAYYTVEASTDDEVLRELHALSTLSGVSGVVQLKEFFWHDSTVYIVMSLLNGGSLHSLAADRGSYTEDDTRELMRCLLQTVNRIHANGFVHRDLKLDNFVLAEPYDLSSVTILDFGLSGKMNTRRRELTECCGSPDYVAPEVIAQSARPAAGRRVPGYGKECDLWALGVAMYVLLSGYPPFVASTVGECLKRVYAGDFDFSDPVWEFISFEAKDLICSLLTVDPGERATVVEALAHPWFRMDE
jgi:serine/threonine protein kinase